MDWSRVEAGDGEGSGLAAAARSPPADADGRDGSAGAGSSLATTVGAGAGSSLATTVGAGARDHPWQRPSGRVRGSPPAGRPRRRRCVADRFHHAPVTGVRSGDFARLAAPSAGLPEVFFASGVLAVLFVSFLRAADDLPVI